MLFLLFVDNGSTVFYLGFMETNHSPSTDFDAAPFTMVARHVSDWTPVALVVDDRDVEMPARAREWFADQLAVSL